MLYWLLTMTRSHPLVLLAIAVAFALRLYRLGAQPIYGDEGLSVLHASEDLPRMLWHLADVGAQGEGGHPPLFHVTLRYWMALFGHSEMAMRYLPLVYGTLSIPVLYAVARRLAGDGVAVLAAWLMAVSPFHVQYSQELRMYTQVTFWSLMSAWLLLGALDRERWLSWAAYTLSAAATIYSHYYGLLVLFSQACYVLWRQGGSPARLRRPLVSGLGIGVLYLPWVLTALGTIRSVRGTSATSASVVGVAGQVLWGTLGAFAIGPAAGLDVPVYPMAVAAGVFAMGLRSMAVSKPGRVRPLAFIVLSVVVPVVMVSLIPLTAKKFDARYLMPVYPFFLVGLAHAAQSVLKRSRAASVVLTATLLAMALWGVLVFFTDRQFLKGDHPSALRFIAERSQPTDVLVVTSEWHYYSFLHYYRGNLLYRLVALEHLGGMDEVARASAEAIKGASRVWLLVYGLPPGDDRSRVERWMDENLFKMDNRWFGAMRVAVYSVPEVSSAAEPAHRTAFRFLDGVVLEGYSATPRVLHIGDTLNLSLFWRSSGPLAWDWTVFTHLVAPDGSRVVAQKDNPPRDGAYPTTKWKPGELIRDNYGLTVLPGTPSGQYWIEVGLYRTDVEGYPRMPVVDDNGRTVDNRVLLGEVEVLP